MGDCQIKLELLHINRGYHGILEVTLPFDEQSVKDYFAHNFGVKISTAYNNQTLAAACNDAQTYTETMCKRKLVNLSVQQKSLERAHLNTAPVKVSGSSTTLFHSSSPPRREKDEPNLQSNPGQNPKRPK